MPPLAIMGGLMAAGSIGGAAIGASSAGNAADAQVQAANHSADVQQQIADKNLAFQQQMWNTQQSNMAPWMQTGRTALGTLSGLMGLPSSTNGGAAPNGVGPTGGTGYNVSQGAPSGMQVGNRMQPMGGKAGAINGGGANFGALNSLNPRPGPGNPNSGPTGMPGSPGVAGASGNFVPFSPWTQTFKPPTDVTEQNDPGYQFRLSQGQHALDATAAANGTLLSGAGIKPFERFSQDYASNEYDKVYNRSLNSYDLGYNQFENNQTNQWNRLAALSGLGQTSTAQLNNSGSQTGSTVGSIYGNLGSQLGQDYNNAGAARGSGYVGSGNAWSSGLSGGSNSLMQMMLLKQLGQNNGYDPNAPAGS